MIGTCEKCERPATRVWRCDEHYKCDDCGTAGGLCFCDSGLRCKGCETKRVARLVREFKGETDFTDYAVCPHCGYRFSDSYELGEGEQECNRCERWFELERDVSVSYSTSKIDPPRRRS